MIVDERFSTYVASLEAPEEPLLERIEAEALAARVPIIRKETQSFLKTLLVLKKPRKVLEIGTAVGFSALLMSAYLPEGGHITTIENYEKRIPIARENFRQAGKEGVISLIQGDALAVMKELTEAYDLPEAVRLLAPGGVLVSDNVLQGGDVLESRFAVERRDRTIHSRMREYLYELKHHDQLQTSILPLGDGVALSVRKN